MCGEALDRIKSSQFSHGQTWSAVEPAAATPACAGSLSDEPVPKVLNETTLSTPDRVGRTPLGRLHDPVQSGGRDLSGRHNKFAGSQNDGSIEDFEGLEPPPAAATALLEGAVPGLVAGCDVVCCVTPRSKRRGAKGV